MRELKFRIPLKCNQCKKIGYDYQYWNGQQFITNNITPCCNKRAYQITGEPQQFTGLLDKSGVEIYEGDIVVGRIGVLGGFRHSVFGVVKYQGMAFSFQGQQGDGSEWFYTIISNFHQDDHIVVAGNIHENPELLEAK